jgi:prolyl oligopeptidase
MKILSRVLFRCLIPFLLCLISAAQTPTSPTPPQTRRDDVTETLHGVTVVDRYRWLEDQNSAETRGWIKDENSYTHALLDNRPGRDKLEARFSQLRKVDVVQLPTERNGRYVYRKRLADQDQYVIYARNGLEGKEEVLIDPNPMSADHSTNVEPIDLSHDGRVLAYMLRKGGRDDTEIHLFDIPSHRDMADALPAALYFDVSQLPDLSGFYYTVLLRHARRRPPPALSQDGFRSQVGSRCLRHRVRQRHDRCRRCLRRRQVSGHSGDPRVGGR